MIRFKIDVIQALKEKGVTPYTSRKNGGGLSQMTFKRIIKDHKVPAVESLDHICRILNCQPGDILEWVPDEEEN